MDEILEEDQRRGRRRRRKTRKKDTLPPHLEALMGQANILYMKRDFNRALEILRTIVREAPKSVAPYHTLGLIYEERGDARRALDFYMIAALLDKSNVDLWRKNAISSRTLENIDQAIFCFSMAVRMSKGQDETSLEALAQLREENGDIRYAASTYEKLLGRRPDDKHVVEKIVELYESIALPEKAVDVLFGFVERSIEKGIDNLDTSMVVQLVVRMLNLKRYLDAGALLSRYSIITAENPEKFPVELRIKLAVCNIRLGSKTHKEELAAARNVLCNRVKSLRSLYWELGDALLDAGHYEDAISVFDEIVDKTDVDALLLRRRGEALKQLNMWDEARIDLEKAVQLSPRMIEASMQLLELYQRTGETSKIGGLLNSIEGIAEERSEAMAAAKNTVKRILGFAERYEKTDLHRYIETLIPLMEAARNLPRRNAADASKGNILDIGSEGHDADDGDEIDYEHLESEQGDAEHGSNWLFRYSTRRQAKAKPSRKYGFSMRDVGIAVRKVLTDEQYLCLLEKFWEAMCRANREEEAASIISRLVYLKEVSDDGLVLKLRLLGVAASLRGNQLMHAYDELRKLCVEYSDQPTFWYVLNGIIGLVSAQKEKRLSIATFKFMSRLAQKTSSLPCVLSIGNSFMSNNTYRCAEAMYIRAYTMRPTEPLLSLLLAIAYLHLSQGRRIQNRAECLMKGFTFLSEYRRLRQDGSTKARTEVLYNFARYFHFCNLLHIAAPLYEDVLATDVLMLDKKVHRDAAYNLVQLYTSCGAHENANRIVYSYLQF